MSIFDVYAFHLLVLTVSNFERCYSDPSWTEREKLFANDQHKLFQAGFTSLFNDHVQTSSEKLSSIGSECWNSLKDFSNKINSNDSLTLKALQASGKFPANFNRETYADFGDFEACLGISTPNMGDNSIDFPKYCLFSLVPDFEKMRAENFSDSIVKQVFPIEFYEPAGQSLRIGMCTLSKCNSTEIHRVMNEALRKTVWRQSLDCHCQQKSDFLTRLKRANLSQKICFLFLTTILILVVIAGLLDLLDIEERSSKLRTIRHFFSPKKSLLMIIADEEGERCTSLDRYRLFTLVLVLTVHVPSWPVLMFTLPIYSNFTFYREIADRVYVQPFMSLFFLEGLLFLGGYASSSLLWRKIDHKTSLLTCVLFVVKRLVIFGPLLLIAITMDIILPLFDSGPLYESLTNKLSDKCSKNFLYNTFHLTNLQNRFEICAIHSWNFSVELQLYSVAVLIIYLYKRSTRVGLLLNVSLIFCGFFYATILAYTRNIQIYPFLYPFKMTDTDNFLKYYFRTLPHSWSYLCATFFSVSVLKNWVSVISPKIMAFGKRSLWLCIVIGMLSSSVWNVLKIEPSAENRATFYLLFNSFLIWMGFFLIMGFAAELRRVFGDSGHHSSNVQVNEDGDPHNNENLIQPTPDLAREANKTDRLVIIFLRIARAAYFSHNTLLIWFYARTRYVMDIGSPQYIFRCVCLFFAIWIVGIFFHLVVIGPYTRIYSHLTERKGKSIKIA